MHDIVQRSSYVVVHGHDEQTLCSIDRHIGYYLVGADAVGVCVGVVGSDVDGRVGEGVNLDVVSGGGGVEVFAAKGDVDELVRYDWNETIVHDLESGFESDVHFEGGSR